MGNKSSMGGMDATNKSTRLATMNEKTGIMEKDELGAAFDDEVKYLCYGDIIMLNYTKKIFRADVAERTR